MGYKTVRFCVIFQFLTLLITIAGAGSGSDQMMRLLEALKGQSHEKVCEIMPYYARIGLN
jgi:hypothetical protein